MKCQRCEVEFIPTRPHQHYCSGACRVAAHRAKKLAESALDAPQRVTQPGDGPDASRRHVTRQFAIPERVDAESRRVVEYVNGEIERWNAGQRTEPIDLILEAARERLRRLAR